MNRKCRQLKRMFFKVHHVITCPTQQCVAVCRPFCVFKTYFSLSPALCIFLNTQWEKRLPIYLPLFISLCLSDSVSVCQPFCLFADRGKNRGSEGTSSLGVQSLRPRGRGVCPQGMEERVSGVERVCPHWYGRSQGYEGYILRGTRVHSQGYEGTFSGVNQTLTWDPWSPGGSCRGMRCRWPYRRRCSDRGWARRPWSLSHSAPRCTVDCNCRQNLRKEIHERDREMESWVFGKLSGKRGRNW